MITGHMIVKNEDVWVWFAIKSVLPYLDRLIITDTGSTDRTVKIVNSFKSKKIEFDIQKINSAKEVTNIRKKHIKKTKNGWIWLIDGDEIYTDRLCREITKLAKDKNNYGILTKRYDLLGDVYHRQSEKIGSYNLFGYEGHASTRLINKDKFKGLDFHGDYPLEGYYDENNKSIKDYPKKYFPLTKNRYWHAGYLTRSSNGANLKNTLNRNKFKTETGKIIKESLPEVFYEKRPSYIPNPLQKRGVIYTLLAKVITPVKKLKRAVL